MTNKLMYFIGNWKMFGDFSSIKIIKKLHRFSISFRNLRKRYKIILCVPNTLINFFIKKIKSEHISIGAQNCHFNQKYGPFTGSVSSSMLKSVGARYVILGHSENRSEGDTNFIIRKKIYSALKEGLIIIFCIGETLQQRRKRKTLSVLKNQIKGSMDKKYDLNKIIFAYEPVWSIGTGVTPKAEELKKTFYFVKNIIKKMFKIKKSPRVLYGGSVNSKNVKKFSSISEIDGFLIGGASQSSKKFIDIIKNYYK